MPWQPSASLPALQQRAVLYQKVRTFFLERQVLEVEVPVLSQYATIDPFIDSLETTVMGQKQYLQTSPEFFLKRLLSVYKQDFYSLGKVFRQGEKGVRHQPEFTMLEWYRVDWNEQTLMDEVRQLVNIFLPRLPWLLVSYRELFQQYLGLDPHTATVAELRTCAQSHIDSTLDSDDKNPWLDMLFTHRIEPQLPAGLVGVYDYPASQAALARIANDSQQQAVAKRFEIYLDGIELANGYWELTDAKEQEQRFAADQYYRQKMGLPSLPYDQYVVDALHEGGLPQCAGVALGIDRLLMCLLKEKNIAHVMAFAK